MRKHRFILIGHGVISKSYIHAISQIKHAEIVGVVGRNHNKVKPYALEQGIKFYGTSLADIAKQSEASAVIICTPNAVHYDAVMEASQLGLHCLCEKPLDISPVKQLEMINTCKKNGVKLAVSYMRRFLNHMQFVKEVINSGKLGRITVVDVTLKHFRPKEYYDSWHGTYSMDGGGPFIQQGSHMLDMVLWLCGGYNEVLDARRFQVYHDIETEDHGYAIIRYGNGAVGIIEASTASFGLSKDLIEISGTKGSISANYDKLVSFEIEGMEQPKFDKNTDLFVQLISDFMECVDTGREPFIHGDSARLATELVVDIYKKSGDPIKTIPANKNTEILHRE